MKVIRPFTYEYFNTVHISDAQSFKNSLICHKTTSGFSSGI